MKIFFIGCGNMGEAFLKIGLEKKVFTNNEVVVFEKSSERKKYLKDTYSITIAEKLEDVQASEVVFLGIKPQNLEDLLIQRFEGKIVISILAGTRIVKIIEKFVGAKIARAMPNLGQFVKQGMSGIFFGTTFSVSEKDFVKSIFKAGGEVLEVDKELDLDNITAISGSGPAYFFYFTEKLIESALVLGFSKEMAEVLVRQTFLGSAEILNQYKDDSVADWRNKVTSRGGTTEKAIENFENSDFETIVLASVRAAQKRAEELGA